MSKSKIKVVLNGAGVRSLLKSQEMMSVCEAQAKEIVQRAGEGYETSAYTGKSRVNVSVYPGDYKAMKDNSENNTLLKAVRG